jgi:hypothetical protein
MSDHDERTEMCKDCGKKPREKNDVLCKGCREIHQKAMDRIARVQDCCDRFEDPGDVE